MHISIFGSVTHTVVDGFETRAQMDTCGVRESPSLALALRRLLPAHKGIISRTPGDLLLFCLWVVTVPRINWGRLSLSFRPSL